MSSIKQLEQLKTKVQEMEVEYNRAQGRLEETEKRMKDEFEVGSIEEAKQLLQELQKKEEKAEADFEKALEKFHEKWGEQLGI